MNVKLISTFSKPDVAGILSACGYAVREEISLFAAIEKMGFGIDTNTLKNITDETELTLLAVSCATNILKKNGFGEESK